MGKLDIGIELTNHCNFACTHCPHSIYGQKETPSGNRFERPKGYMKRELFDRAIVEACRHARHVAFGFFGEQLLHPQFDRMILGIPPKRGFTLRLNTNWSLVTRKTVPVLRCFDTIEISLDAGDGPTWEALCPGSPLLDLDGEPTEDRYGTLVAKIRWWLELKERPPVRLIYVRRDMNMDTGKCVEEWQPRLRRGDVLVTKSVLSYGGVMHDPTMKPHRCHVAEEERLTIGWDGRCSPCNLDVDLAMTAGDLNVQSMVDILESPAWRQMLENIRKQRGICQNCFDAGNHSQRRYHPKGRGST